MNMSRNASAFTMAAVKIAALLLVVFLLDNNHIVTAQLFKPNEDFRQIAMPDTGDTTPVGVVLPAICIGNFIAPKTMYTIEPTKDGETDVKILTNPPDLVEIGFDDKAGVFYFKFIQAISQDANDAGVIIQFPPDQLKSVNACCSQTVQIKEGFTHFESLMVSTNAVVHAVFDVQQNSDMMVNVTTAAEANVQVTETDGKKNTDVDIFARDNAKVDIDGDITTLMCDDQSDCMISGVVSDPDDSSIRGRSNVQTTSCEDIDVTEDSICRSKTPYVNVDVDGELFISGVKEKCVGGEDLNGLSLFIDPSKTSPPTISPQPTTTASLSPIESIAPSPSPLKSPTFAPTYASAATNVKYERGGISALLVSNIIIVGIMINWLC